MSFSLPSLNFGTVHSTEQTASITPNASQLTLNEKKNSKLSALLTDKKVELTEFDKKILGLRLALNKPNIPYSGSIWEEVAKQYEAVNGKKVCPDTIKNRVRSLTVKSEKIIKQKEGLNPRNNQVAAFTKLEIQRPRNTPIVLQTLEQLSNESIKLSERDKKFLQIKSDLNKKNVPGSGILEEKIAEIYEKETGTKLPPNTIKSHINHLERKIKKPKPTKNVSWRPEETNAFYNFVKNYKIQFPGYINWKDFTLKAKAVEELANFTQKQFQNKYRNFSEDASSIAAIMLTQLRASD